MTKKTAILIIIVSILTIGVIGYLFYTNILFRGFTGYAYSTPPPEEIAERSAMDKLQNALPLSTDKFSINRFDYSKGNFVVIFTVKTASPEAEFNSWYQSSSYKAIPFSMFTLIDDTKPVKD